MFIVTSLFLNFIVPLIKYLAFFLAYQKNLLLNATKIVLLKTKLLIIKEEINSLILYCFAL